MACVEMRKTVTSGRTKPHVITIGVVGESRKIVSNHNEFSQEKEYLYYFPTVYLDDLSIL